MEIKQFIIDTSFLLLLWPRDELLKKYRVPVDTAAPDIDSDVPHAADNPVVMIVHRDSLSVGYQHLGLHLLAGVIF